MTHLCPTLCASHRDDGYAGSNLFIVRGPAALRLPELWLRVEPQRKRPWRVAAGFGPLLLLGYLLRWFTLDEAMARIPARLGVRVAAVKMPMAAAAIDVDKAEDRALVEEILTGQPSKDSADAGATSDRKSVALGNSVSVRVE